MYTAAETQCTRMSSGALSIASVLLYPKTLGGCAVFSGFLPFDSSSSSFAARVTDEAKKVSAILVAYIAPSFFYLSVCVVLHMVAAANAPPHLGTEHLRMIRRYGDMWRVKRRRQFYGSTGAPTR